MSNKTNLKKSAKQSGAHLKKVVAAALVKCACKTRSTKPAIYEGESAGDERSETSGATKENGGKAD
tara:strand:+ start:1696 stop:1893 length:198 start_codon:yes stop_codon:yes gene_type:complete